MKKALSLTLALTLLLSLLTVSAGATAGGTAYASTQAVLVDGTAVTFQAYALKDANGNDTNYVKLRDVAQVLQGTAVQFEVGWNSAVNIETGKSYTSNGSEMKTPFSGNRAYSLATAPTNINGAPAGLEAIVLLDDNGGAYTYYKLRDLGTALGFTVDWSAEKGIFIETGSAQAPTPIPEPTPEPTPEPAPTVTVPENEISRMLKNPSYYVGQYVDRMPAKIFNIPQGGMYLQVNAGPEEVNTYITLNAKTTLAEDDYVLISGTVIGPYSYKTIANETRTVANIQASNVELTTKAAIDAANQAQTLAAHGVTINLPATPITVQEHDWNDKLVATYQITAIDVKQEYYEYSNEVTVTLSFTGECIGRYTNTDTNCEIIWTLKDAEGYKIDSGSAYSPILEEGDKFRNVEALIFDLEPNQTYNLDIGTSIK